METTDSRKHQFSLSGHFCRDSQNTISIGSKHAEEQVQIKHDSVPDDGPDLTFDINLVRKGNRMRQSFLSTTSTTSSGVEDEDDEADDDFGDELSYSMTNLSFSGIDCSCSDFDLQHHPEMNQLRTDRRQCLNPELTTSDVPIPTPSTSLITNRCTRRLPAEKAAFDESVDPDPRSKLLTLTDPAFDLDFISLDVQNHEITRRPNGSSGQCSSRNSSSGLGSDQGSDAPNYPPQVVPPHDWGISRQRRPGRGGDDPNDEDNYRRQERGSSRSKPSRAKKYACPAAKGDPFNNPGCLGVSFPNLAKTRQHLACNLHFRVNSTTKLPDEVRDPNGWDEIQRYAYPDQEIPSSDEDYYKTLDVIQEAGAGPGQPDFRSHIIRMIRCSMEDPVAGRQIISALEAINSESPSQKPGDWCMVAPHVPSSSPSDPGQFPASYDTTGGNFENLYEGLSYPFPESLNNHSGHSPEATRAHWSATGHAAVVTSSPGFFAHDHGITSSSRDAAGHHLSGYFPQENIIQHTASSLAILDHRQVPQQHPRVDVKLQGSHVNSSYHPVYRAVDFESWVQATVCPGFSFDSFWVHLIQHRSASVEISSPDHLWDIYTNLWRHGPDLIVKLVIEPKATHPTIIKNRKRGSQ